MMKRRSSQFTPRLALSAAAIFLIICHPASVRAQEQLVRQGELLDRLGINVPYSVSGSRALSPSIGALVREPCDRPAVMELAAGLERAGYRRDAARALVNFSGTCGGHAAGLRRAANLYIDVSDWQAAADVADKIIEAEPASDNGFYLRAMARDRANQWPEAIDDYLTAIALFPDKERIANVAFFGAARAYEKLGLYCDGIVPLQAWIAANPARNDNSQTQTLIRNLVMKGDCRSKVAEAGDAVPIRKRGQVVTLLASINGKQGTFILDTGATFVSLRRSFAEQAKVHLERGSVVRLNTANGVTQAQRGRAALIKLQKVEASDVPVVVQDDVKATYGAQIDGLLGMSFLSRFDILIDRQVVRIKPRKG